MILILVMAFFMLGCSFSCSGMKESFANNCGPCKFHCCSPDCRGCPNVNAGCASACGGVVGGGR